LKVPFTLELALDIHLLSRKNQQGHKVIFVDKNGEKEIIS